MGIGFSKKGEDIRKGFFKMLLKPAYGRLKIYYLMITDLGNENSIYSYSTLFKTIQTQGA